MYYIYRIRNNLNGKTYIGKHNIKWSDEQKKKLSEARKGERNPMYGKHLSEEHKRKISEQKKKLYKQGRHWFNNGTLETLVFECPDGFVPGRVRK